MHLSNSFGSLTKNIFLESDGLIVCLKLVHFTDPPWIFVKPVEMHSSNLTNEASV